MQDRESAVEADWWRGGASGSQSPAEKRTWAFLGTLDSPSSPSSSPTVNSFFLSSFLPQHYPYLPSFDSSDRGDFIYIMFISIFNDISILQHGYQFSVSILGHLPGLRSEQSIRTTGTISTTSFVCIFSMKHQPFNCILFGFKCSSVICSSPYRHLPK